jgi:urease accessory protein
MVLVDPVWSDRPLSATLMGPHAIVVPLDGPGVQVVALAADAIALRRALDAGARAGGVVADGGIATPCP